MILKSLISKILSISLVVLLVVPVFAGDPVLVCFDQSRRDMHLVAGYGIATAARFAGCTKDEAILIGFLGGALWEQLHYQNGSDYDVGDVFFTYVGAVVSQVVHEWLKDNL